MEPGCSLGILESRCRFGHLAFSGLGRSSVLPAGFSQAHVDLEFHSLSGPQEVRFQVA